MVSIDPQGHHDHPARDPCALAPGRLPARYWRWKSRSLGGRPQVDADLRALIRRMSADRGNDPICIKRATDGYPTQQWAANAGEKALRRFLESEALKQEQGIMADKHSKPPETPNDNAKSIDRWDDEGGAPSGGRSVRKRPRRDRAKRSSSRGRLRTSSSRVKGRMSTAI
jgi:hypothetical protein